MLGSENIVPTVLEQVLSVSSHSIAIASPERTNRPSSSQYGVRLHSHTSCQADQTYSNSKSKICEDSECTDTTHQKRRYRYLFEEIKGQLSQPPATRQKQLTDTAVRSPWESPPRPGCMFGVPMEARA